MPLVLFVHAARRAIGTELEFDVQWVYFPLHPDTPAEGLLLKDLFAGRNFDIEAAQAHLKTLLDAEGLKFSPAHAYV